MLSNEVTSITEPRVQENKHIEAQDLEGLRKNYGHCCAKNLHQQTFHHTNQAFGSWILLVWVVASTSYKDFRGSNSACLSDCETVETVIRDGFLRHPTHNQPRTSTIRRLFPTCCHWSVKPWRRITIHDSTRLFKQTGLQQIYRADSATPRVRPGCDT